MKPDRRTSRRSRQMGVSAFPDAAHGSGNGFAFSAAGSSGIAHRTQENETVLRRAARPENDACEAEWKYRSIFDEALEGIFQTIESFTRSCKNLLSAKMTTNVEVRNVYSNGKIVRRHRIQSDCGASVSTFSTPTSSKASTRTRAPASLK